MALCRERSGLPGAYLEIPQPWNLIPSARLNEKGNDLKLSGSMAFPNPRQLNITNERGT
jgi:hypothetical protein